MWYELTRRKRFWNGWDQLPSCGRKEWCLVCRPEENWYGGGIPLPRFYLPREDQCSWYVSCPLVRLLAEVVWWLSQNTDSGRPLWLTDFPVTQGPWHLSPCWSLFLGQDCRTILLSFLYAYMCSWFTGGPHSSLETEKWGRTCIGHVWLCARQFSAYFKGCIRPGLLTELSFTLLVENNHGETPTAFAECTYCGNLILYCTEQMN